MPVYRDKVWINTLVQEGQAVVDGWTGTTVLGELAATRATAYSAIDAFLGLIPTRW